MLSFLAPGYLVAALVAAAGLVATHCIVRREPRGMLLPTARFVPDAPALATGWARVPSDLLPLLLRVACVVLAGLALAGPFFQGRGSGTARVILADRSRAVADSAELRDSVAAVRGPGDVVIGYGGTGSEETQDASGARPALAARASLSAGLVAATRVAAGFRASADSVELVIVSSFAAEELDAATARVRREWPGRARLVRVAAPTQADSARSPVLVSESSDPLAVVLALVRPETPADVRIIRRDLTSADSLWVTGRAGRVLVHWPASTAPAGFIARPRSAAAAGVIGQGPAVIAQLQRRWQYVPTPESVPVAWWIDGDVAGAESALGGGCLRSAAVPVSAAGDFVLRPDFHVLLRELMQPCGGAQMYAPVPAATLAMLGGGARLAPAGAFAQARIETSSLATWLLIASLACALLELPARRRRARGPMADLRESAPPARKVA
ncbi:MAG: BatA domain-containing protein [Gemmatimonadaceae bacterium]